MGLWEISSFSLWVTLHLTDGSKTPGINPYMISQWGNSQIAETVDKSKCIWFWCWVHSRTKRSSCRLSQSTWIHQGQHSSTQAESQCNYPAAVKPRWCNSRYQARNSQRWWAVTVEVHCDNRMARMNQRSPKRSATLLDFQRRTDSRKWATSEINTNYHPKSDEEQVPEWAAHRTPWNHQMHRTGKTDNVLARNKQWHWAIHGNLPALLEICSIQQKMPRKEEPVKARDSSNTMDKVRHRHFHIRWNKLPIVSGLHV